MARIRVQSGFNQGSIFELAGKSLIIGRDTSSDILLHIESPASRRHASVQLLDGNWFIEDLESVNGTFLNGARIKQTALKHGDRITIGDAVFVYENGEALPEGAADSGGAFGGGADAAALTELVRLMSERTALIEREIAKVIVGQVEIVREVLTAILSRGHVLLIGMPGLAKTTLVSTIAKVLDLRFRRIQFTPDLMPGDITGTDILEVDEQTGKKEYRFIQGPVFSQILLADEINRTPPKTQAALLEAMQEYRVTAAGQTFELEPPFFVLATQNPLEQEGTYPLPEAQLDRFMFSVYIDYPSEADEETIARVTTSGHKPVLRKILDAPQIIELQNAVRDLPVSDHVIKYAVRLVRSTRPGDVRAPDFIKKWIHCGAGPRAAQNLLLAAKARAIIEGRLLVTTDDVRAIARPVLRHRMFTNFAADSEGMDTDKIVRKMLETVAEPGQADY